MLAVPDLEALDALAQLVEALLSAAAQLLDAGGGGLELIAQLVARGATPDRQSLTRAQQLKLASLRRLDLRSGGRDLVGCSQRGDGERWESPAGELDYLLQWYGSQFPSPGAQLSLELQRGCGRREDQAGVIDLACGGIDRLAQLTGRSSLERLAEDILVEFWSERSRIANSVTLKLSSAAPIQAGCGRLVHISPALAPPAPCSPVGRSCLCSPAPWLDFGVGRRRRASRRRPPWRSRSRPPQVMPRDRSGLPWPHRRTRLASPPRPRVSPRVREIPARRIRL